jgi:ribokinase
MVLEKVGLNKDDILITHFAPNLDEIIKAINYADQKGAKVILNPSPLSDFPTDILSKIDLVTVNEEEAKGISKLLEYPWSNYELFAYDVGNRFNNDWIVTLGEDGSIAYYDPGYGKGSRSN